MSIFNHYTLSPGAVASMTQPTPDLQRNYRQRDMLEGYGELQENGRWLYSLNDLVAIWICDRLSQNGQVMERREGFRMGAALAGRVITALILGRYGGHSDLSPLKARFAVYAHEGHSRARDGKPYGSTFLSMNALEELERHEFDYVQIVDVENLAKNIPDQIRGLLIAADENEKDELVPNMDGLDD